MGKNVGYYYCSLETANSILKNHSLWFSDPLKMNDCKEITWFFENIFKYNDYEFACPYEIKSNPFCSVSTVSDLIDKGQYALYCLCLSQDRDSLGQWRGYADNGRGVAIGIDIDEVKKNDEEHITDFQINYVNNLNELDQKEKVEVKEEIQQIIKKTEEKNPNYSQYKSAMPLLYVSDLLRAAIKFKSPYFKQEEEVRLLFDLGDDVKNRGSFIKNRFDARLGVIQYHDFKFNSENNPITEVVVGPAFAGGERIVKEMLRCYGYDIDVNKSEIQYR